MSKKHQHIQATHAVAQYCLDYDDWQNDYLITLKNKKLDKLIDRLDEDSVVYSTFKDSFFGDKITAVAAVNIGEYVEELELI